jgi:hypothetical protein
LRKYPFTILGGEELAVVSGISEWARRVRELRVQFGWPILSDITAKQMAEEAGECHPVAGRAVARRLSPHPPGLAQNLRRATASGRPETPHAICLIIPAGSPRLAS